MSYDVMKFFEQFLPNSYNKKNQSLGYQIRHILMKQHCLSRKDENLIGSNDGGDNLIIKKEEFRDLLALVYFEVSDNYKKKLNNLKNSEIMMLIIALLEEMDKKYCEIELKKDSLVFKMNQEGYRYQYNGYKKADIKLLEKANIFIFLTLVYYIFDFIFENPDKKMNWSIIPMLIFAYIAFVTHNECKKIKVFSIIAILILLKIF